MRTRAYTQHEVFADGIIHLIGVVGGLVAATALVTASLITQPVTDSAAILVYAVAMVAMFSFSAAYNLIDHPGWKDPLRRCDQAAIFLKIAGTYTPFALVKIGGVAGAALFSGVWLVAVAGAAGKLFIRRRWDHISVVLYLALGWVGVIAFYPVVESINLPSLVLLAIGGALYSLGVVFHLWSSLPYQNAIWHLFVLIATFTHFAAIAFAVFA